MGRMEWSGGGMDNCNSIINKYIFLKKEKKENPIDSTKKLLDLINELGKTAGYKVNTEKSKA